ncbi:MAG: exosporium glycoprotein BclB-related protein [Bacteroidota bacterium]
MQRSFLLLLLLTVCTHAITQNVGIGTATPHANAVLDIKQTTNKGLLIPRGNAATRTALNSNTAKGLMLYDTSTNSLWIHNGNGLADGWTNQVATNSSTIIPYASGTPIQISTNANGTPDDMALIGFGNNSFIKNNSGNIELTGSNRNYAFVMPRDGTITALSAHFTLTTPFTSFATMLISAQLYISPADSDVFTPVPLQLTTIPSLSFALPGTTTRGITTGLSIPVTAQSRILLVFYAFSFGDLAANTVVGFASAGLNIQ